MLIKNKLGNHDYLTNINKIWMLKMLNNFSKL